MSRTYKDSRNGKAKTGPPRGGSGRDRRISVRGVRREPADLRKLSRAVIAMALAEAAAEQAASAAAAPTTPTRPTTSDTPSADPQLTDE